MPKSPHPAFSHLLPSFGREKAKLFEIIAFSRAVRVGEGAQRADEGPLLRDSIYYPISLASIASQISAAMSAPPKRFTSRMPVGEVTLISVS